MEEEKTPSILSRKELRKQKLMEYLTAKGKLKLSNPKLYPRDDCQVKNPVASALKVVKGKEKNAPVDSLCEARKVHTLAPQSSQHPARKASGVANKVIVKGSILNAQQNSSRSSASSGQALLKLDQNRGLTNKYSVSSKSNLHAASHLKKQPKPGMQSSVKASSNATCTTVAKSSSRFSSSSNATWSCSMKTVSLRMSLGPIVKTKTGLVPAVIQPRNTKSNLTHTSATVAGTTAKTNISVTNKMRSSTSSSLSKSSSGAQGKTFHNVTLNKPVHERATFSQNAKAVIKTQDQKKSNSKPLLGKHSQPPCKSQLLTGLKSISSSSKCRAAPVKPEGSVGMPKTNESAGQSTDRSTKQRSQAEGEKNGRPCKVASRTSSGLVSRCSFRVVSGVTRAAVAEQGGKTEICKKGYSSAKAPAPQTGTKRTSAPVMSQTVPRPARAISYSGRATETKTPKVPVRIIPQTEGKTQTAAQEERMNKLQAWREAKGISYKRPPMPVKPLVRRTVSVHQPFWAAMKEEDEVHTLIYAVDRSLADCLKLLGEGCPSDQVKGVLSRLPPVSQKFAKYWICKARLMEQEGNLDVLPMFEEAVRVVLEPVDELRTVVFEILKKKDEIQASGVNEKEEEDFLGTVISTPESSNNSMKTPPKSIRALICGEKGESSVVKYKISATPGGPASQQREPARINGQELRFFTPVRRSVRIERASLRYPASLQDHDLCVASYNDLIAEEDKENSDELKNKETSPSTNNTLIYIYRQNEALEDKVLVQLFHDEDSKL